MKPPLPTGPQADCFSVRELFKLGRFEAAKAQRDYQWEEKQWRHLLSDINNAFKASGLDVEPEPEESTTDDAEGTDDPETSSNEPVEEQAKTKTLARPAKLSHYYLGHMLLLPRQANDQFYIYDGQQRLTTLTLLLCALRDAAGEEGWLPLQEILRTPPPDKHPRLILDKRVTALARVVGALGGTRPGSHGDSKLPADQQIYKAGTYFLGKVRGWSEQRRKAFTAFVLDNVYLTATRMRDRRVAEYAYITINTRGKPLENKDIIKGHFVQLASRRSLTDANEMAEAWARLEKQAGKYLNSLLRIAFMLDYRAPATFDFGAQLMTYFDDESRLDEVRHWVEVRLPAIVRLHRVNVLEPQRDATLPLLEASLRRLTFLPWKQWQALVFHFVERDQRAPSRFEASIKALERWCFAINLLDLDEDRISAKVIRALAQKDPFASGCELRLGTDWRQHVRDRLNDGQVTDVERRGAHVRWLETLEWPAHAINFASTNDTSVEHVLPQHPTGQWLVDFPTSPLIYSEKFGNLCLIPKALNKLLENKQYEEKWPAYLKLEAHYKSALDVAKSEVWRQAEVDARTKRLAERAIKVLRV